VLVALDRDKPDSSIERSMDELSLLALTAGAEVVDTMIQKRSAPDAAYYIGKGKAEELKAVVDYFDAELVIFNDELSPSQVRNLDRILGVKTIDRTALILDIFARRAISRDGKLQVELAQMQYLLPRLIGLGQQLSRLGGGIGTRGPGETQLEIDRRVIRKRISDLKKEIIQLRKHRLQHRKRRAKNRCTVVSLVGYTNAGKSTLLNALTGANLYTEDKLFATLDPSVRRGKVDHEREVLYTDTVGFIEELPRQLVTAFRATLEEIAAADILLHVVDISHPHWMKQISIVREHLSHIDPDFHQRELMVFNKIDLLEDESLAAYLKREFPGACFISALAKANLENLKESIIKRMDLEKHRLELKLPYSEGRLLAAIKAEGDIFRIDYREDYIEVDAEVSSSLAGRLEKYMAG